MELEAEGGGFDWRGHSDTETLLAALRHWGLEGGLKRLRGMFAFALWDNSERTLFLARDRMGEKPLYYGRIGSTFFFGSELKGFVVHPQWQGEINRNALALYFRHKYLPSPWSIYEGINKLPPAHFVVIRDTGQTISEPQCYWDLLDVAEHGCKNPMSDESESVDELENLMRDAERGDMASDAPLGAFLSGGFDSSTVVALMQAQSARPVKTFTIGFHEDGYDEAVHARKVARHLGTDHTELYVTPDEAMAVIPTLPAIWDEPFADSSQIPTILVSELARKHVTVSLSGDGGDELFFGYQRYSKGREIWKKLDRLPVSLRRILARGIEKLPWEALERTSRHLPMRTRLKRMADRWPKIVNLIDEESGEALYRQMVSDWQRPASLVYGSAEPETLFQDHERLSRLPDLCQRMMYLDSMTYLPDDILTKVDRASMVVSLEARVPLLDHRVVEFAWQIPMSMKYRDGKGKWLLREVLYRYLPRELMERPKMGFGVPIDEWLRGPLRDWGEQLLSEERLRGQGFLDPAPVRKKWHEHVTGKSSWHYLLWDVLMFQAWLEARA
jgi:asparagine synthase (glutamine-hydrolysing)